MPSSFDFERFNKSLGTILAKSDGFTFDECVRQIEHLRLEYENLHDAQARSCLEREVDRMMLRIVIDKSQPFEVVCECFWRNVKRGFNSDWSEVFSALEYADYCLIANQLAEGVRVLLDVRQRIQSTTGIVTEELKHDLLLEIDKVLNRMHK